MTNKKSIALLGTFIVLGSLWAHNKVQQIQLKMRCYIHRVGDSDNNHPAKVTQVLDYGVVVQCKTLRYEKLEINEHYELMDTFEKEYKTADCYMWDATEEKPQTN